MTNKKLFFAVAVLLICFAPKAWAYDFSAKCESGQTLYYNITSSTQPYTVEVASSEAAKGNLVIPSTVSNDGKKYSVTGIGTNAFYMCKELKSVKMPNSIASIGDSAFYRCEGLTSVNIPKSLNSIGNDAFGGCGNLTNIKIESNADLSAADLYFVKKGIKYAVQDKKSVKVLPNKVIYMGEYKVPDPNSEDPDDPNYITIEEEMEDYFCPEDSIIVIPETITVGNEFTVTSIGNDGFGYCYRIKSITIPNSVTSIGKYAFYGYEDLTSINIPNSVTSINDSAFMGCINLKSVVIPSSVKKIGTDAFSSCDSITNITLKCDIDVSDADLHIIKDGIKYAVQDKKSVKIMSDYGYEEVKVMDPYSDDPDNPDYVLVEVLVKRCPKNPITTIPETINAGDTFTVTSIDYEAFYDCKELLSVTIPNSVTEIGEDAFRGVKNVTYSGTAAGSPWGALMANGYVDGDLVYSDETKTNLVGCSSYATEVIIPNTVTSIDDYAFYGCRDLKSITLPSSLTSIGTEAFRMCYGLNDIYYTGNIAEWCRITFNDQPMRYARNLYINNRIITDLVIPEGITEIKNNAFRGVASLTSVKIPNSVTSIGGAAFEHCGSLTSIKIPNSVKSIGYAAFWGCGGLTSITIPKSVTSIADGAFYECGGLTSITIPKSVTSIGDGAFGGCEKLDSKAMKKIVKINENAFATE